MGPGTPHTLTVPLAGSAMPGTKVIPYCYLFLNIKILSYGVQLPKTLPEIIMKKVQSLF